MKCVLNNYIAPFINFTKYIQRSQVSSHDKIVQRPVLDLHPGSGEWLGGRQSSAGTPCAGLLGSKLGAPGPWLVVA